MSQFQAEPIAVTLVLPAHRVPVWLRNILVRLRNANFVSLSIVVATSEQEWEKSRSSLVDMLMWLETKAYGHKIIAAEHSENLVGISGENGPEHTGTIVTLDDLVQCIQLRKPDLIVWMLPERPPVETVSLAKHGVLTIADAFNGLFGFRELAGHESATRCDVIVYGNVPGEDRVLATSFAATDDMLLARGINGVRAKCEALLLSTIKRVWRRADPRLDGIPSHSTEPLMRVPPDFLQIVWGLLRFYSRCFVANLMRPFRLDQWQIAFRKGGDRLDQKGLQRLAPSHNGFWADPFVAEKDGRKFIFFEEFMQKTSRGHIAAIEIHPDGQVGDPVNVLMRDYHLSYPFLFEYDGSLFMVPECAEAGRVEVFRCKRFPDCWESHAVLLENVCALDPTLIEYEGMWWMFVTIQHDGNSTNDELHLFFADSPFDEWTAHPLNPVRLDVRAARPAGAIFVDEGKLFRPAQDCSGRYGWAISIQEIECMTTKDYSEKEVARISPEWAVGACGTHTINQSCGITVYDCEARRRK